MKPKNNKESEILQITEIKLKLSDSKEITLTSEEARKVYEELGKLFNLEKKNNTLQEAVEELKDVLDKQKDSPTYIPYPIYIERPAPLDPYYSPWKLPEIWCGDNIKSYFFGDLPGTCNSLDAKWNGLLSIDLTDNNTNLPNGGTITNGGLT